MTVKVKLSLKAPEGPLAAGVLVSLLCGDRSLSGAFRRRQVHGHVRRRREASRPRSRSRTGRCAVKRRVVASVLVSRTPSVPPAWARGQTSIRRSSAARLPLRRRQRTARPSTRHSTRSGRASSTSSSGGAAGGDRQWARSARRSRRRGRAAPRSPTPSPTPSVLRAAAAGDDDVGRRPAHHPGCRGWRRSPARRRATGSVRLSVGPAVVDDQPGATGEHRDLAAPVLRSRRRPRRSASDRCGSRACRRRCCRARSGSRRGGSRWTRRASTRRAAAGARRRRPSRRRPSRCAARARRRSGTMACGWRRARPSRPSVPAQRRSSRPVMSAASCRS